MNAGDDLWTLMQQIRLPPHLVLPEVHGKVPWIVRAIWEEHVGWFRYESTTELYDLPPAAIWSDLIEIAGAGSLVQRAKGHIEEGRPLHALHFADILLRQTPKDEIALRVKHSALVQLLDRSGMHNFSEVNWLKAEIREIKTLLGE
jgi:hypothetical protein